MIIHSPIISGSLTFASGATFVLPSNGQYTGSFSGSVSGIGDTAEFSASLNSKIENLKIDTGSQDARLDSIESFTSSIDTTIKNKLNTENVISGSSQVLGGTGIVSSSAQIDSLFNIDGLVSSSTQVKDLLPAGTISGSSQLTTDFDNRYLNTNGDGVVSGSSQIDGTQIQNKSITIAGTSTSLGGSISLSTITGNSGIVSGSSQLTTDFDSRYLNTNGDSVVSGSSQIDLTSTTNYISGIKTRLDAETVISGSSQVNADSITNFDTNVKDKLNADGVVSGSAQVVGILSQLNSYTSSNDAKWSNLESNSGSFARTNSTNIFTGNQTITGSLFVSADLIVQGSSSIQNISSSVLNIGTNLVTVNTNSPSIRFGGLAVIDSGSGGGSGSFLYDSIQDEFIFVHKGNGTNVTSSVALMGPQTIDNLGNETYLTQNRVPKGFGNEHLVDSNITDNGTTITLGSNTTVSGTLLATGTALVSSSAQIDGTQIQNKSITIAGTSTSLGGTITLATITGNSGIVSGSSQLTTDFDSRYLNTNGDGVVSGSSQITLSSTTGFGTYIDQALLTTSTVQFGKVGVGGASDATYELKVTGDIGATGDIVAYISSDERLKDNINLIHNPIEKVKQLRGVTWEWNDLASDAARQSPNVGVIAQDVEKVLPMLVFDRENGYKGVDYSKLIGLLIEVVKEQQEQIEDIRIRLK
jgi:lipopolysaccharide export system protein LptA